MAYSQEDYIRKVQGLLRKAEDKAATDAERDTALRMAQNIMTRWGIDQAMLDAERGSTDDKIVHEEFVLVGIWRYPMGRLTWLATLYNNVKAVMLNNPGWREIDGKVYKQTEVYEVTGFKSDIDRLRILVTSLQIQAMRAELAWWDEHQHLYAGQTSSKQHIARRGFLFGFAEGAGAKMREGSAAGRKAAEEEHGSESVALVLRPRELQVQSAFEARNPSLVKVKDRKDHGSAFAQQKGYEAGKRADTGDVKVGAGSKARELR